MDHLTLISTTLREQLPELAADEVRSLAGHVILEIEAQVGRELSDGLDHERLAEFEALVDAGDDDGASAWLERNRPDHPRIVKRVRDAVLAEAVRTVRARSGDRGNEVPIELDESAALRDWRAVEAYVRRRYADVTRHDDTLVIAPRNDHGRTRTVLVTAPNDRWIQLEAVVGKDIEAQDVRVALAAAYRYIGIGIALSGPYLLARGVISYAGVAGDSLCNTIDLVAATADGVIKALAERDSADVAV